MQFDTSNLDFMEEANFFEQLRIQKRNLDDAYWKVFFDKRADNFLLVKIDEVIHKY